MGVRGLCMHTAPTRHYGNRLCCIPFAYQNKYFIMIRIIHDGSNGKTTRALIINVKINIFDTPVHVCVHVLGFRRATFP